MFDSSSSTLSGSAFETAARATRSSSRAGRRAVPTPRARRCRCTPPRPSSPDRPIAEAAWWRRQCRVSSSAVSSGPGILNPIAGTTTQSGALVPGDVNRHRESLRGRDLLSHADDSHVESRHRHAGHLDQLVGRLKRVEDGGQPEVEDAVESEDVDAHGKYDIKNGVLANTPDCARRLESSIPVTPQRRIQCSSSACSSASKQSPARRTKSRPSFNRASSSRIRRRRHRSGSRCDSGPTTFAIFDAFENEAGRQTHLNGPIAKALMDNAPRLLATPPVIERVEVLGAKLPVEALR